MLAEVEQPMDREPSDNVRMQIIPRRGSVWNRPKLTENTQLSGPAPEVDSTRERSGNDQLHLRYGNVKSDEIAKMSLRPDASSLVQKLGVENMSLKDEVISLRETLAATERASSLAISELLSLRRSVDQETQMLKDQLAMLQAQLRSAETRQRSELSDSMASHARNQMLMMQPPKPEVAAPVCSDQFGNEVCEARAEPPRTPSFGNEDLELEVTMTSAIFDTCAETESRLIFPPEIEASPDLGDVHAHLTTPVMTACDEGCSSEASENWSDTSSACSADVPALAKSSSTKCLLQPSLFDSICADRQLPMAASACAEGCPAGASPQSVGSTDVPTLANSTSSMCLLQPNLLDAIGAEQELTVEAAGAEGANPQEASELSCAQRSGGTMAEEGRPMWAADQRLVTNFGQQKDDQFNLERCISSASAGGASFVEDDASIPEEYTEEVGLIPNEYTDDVSTFSDGGEIMSL